MSADEAVSNLEHLAKDAREFGLQVAKAVLSELEGDGNEERLQAIRSIFLQAIAYVEKQYGAERAMMWQDEANQAIQQQFGALKPSGDSSPEKE
jgi:hypothetical protein